MKVVDLIKSKTLKRNFDWSVTKNGGGTSLFTSASYSQAAFGSGSLIITAGDMKNAGVLALVAAQAHTLSVVFEDGFNDHTTNYNTNRNKNCIFSRFIR